MKVFLNELSDAETELSFTQAEPWVIEAVRRADEHLDENPLHVAPTRPVEVQFSLRKVDEVVVLNGKIDTYIELLCSRCAMPYKHGVHPGFSALFCKDPVMAGVAHKQADKIVGHNRGFARHAHDSESDESVAEGRDLDITYLTQEYIELNEVLTEQLQFQIPFQPLCKESCKGMCTNCGADLNVGRCACAKLTQQKPFSVLKDLKVN